MVKKIAIIIMTALLLLLASCSKVPKKAIVEGKLDVGKYMSTLSDKRVKHLKDQTSLLRHPLKEAVAKYGQDYVLSWEGNYVKLQYPEEKCAFEAYIGDSFEYYGLDDNTVDYGAYNPMEYLSYAVIESVIYDVDGKTLTDGICVGMSVGQINKKLQVDGIVYDKVSAYINDQYDENGNKTQVIQLAGQVFEKDYIITFTEDVLTSVKIADYQPYVKDTTKGDKGMQSITEAMTFLDDQSMEPMELESLAYQGLYYSSYFDSWFYGWQFTEGFFEGYVIHAEQNDPNRIYVANAPDGQPILFWANGQYVDPKLSFLGKWRDYNTNEYIEIKSISKEGVVVFDMYAEAELGSGEMVLLENLSTALDEIPRTFMDYLRAEYNDEALMGDAQFYDGNVQSGFYTYAGDKMYLQDSLILDLNGTVQYLPRGLGGRLGAGPLPVHIPSAEITYTQNSTWGYMESFGRDDPGDANIITTNGVGGQELLDRYLNNIYETSDLQYSKLEYKYLHDYVFPVNNITYHVWESTQSQTPHYLYVDSDNGIIIQECEINGFSKHTKELIYKADTTVSSRSYVNQKFVTLDGKITVDLADRIISKKDSFVENIEIPDISWDMVNGNDRFMFFANIGNRFALNGYVLFDHTTWGATLHITDSNIPEFAIGVYYLNSETFFLDPSIGVLGVPKEEEQEQYLDDKVQDLGKETKMVIRRYNGQIIGYIYVDAQGKKTVKDFYGKILGYYYPDRDVTTDFYGKILTRGDAASMLLFTD